MCFLWSSFCCILLRSIFCVDYCNNADPITFTNVIFYEEIAVLCNLYRAMHGLITCVDIKAKCRYLKKLTCEGTLRQVFNRVYRLDIQSVMLVFSTQLYELLPLKPSFWLTLPTPPPPSLCQSTVYSDSVWLGGGGGCWVLFGTMFCRSLTLCIWTDSEPTKLLDRPIQKPWRRRGAQTDKHLPQSPYTGHFLDDDILLWRLYTVD